LAFLIFEVCQGLGSMLLVSEILIPPFLSSPYFLQKFPACIIATHFQENT